MSPFFDTRALFAFFAGFFLLFLAFRLRRVFKSAESEVGAEGIVNGVGDSCGDGGGESEGNGADGPAVGCSVDGMRARARWCSTACR